MSKVDLKKEFKYLYNPSKKKISVVDVPKMNFIMIDGKGDPNTAKEYMDAIEALFTVSYSLKFIVKKGKTAVDYVVMPLEGLWWADDMSKFSMEKKDDWKWTAMIMQPEYAARDLYLEAVEQAGKKKNLPAITKAAFSSLNEGKSAQLMHIGPYSEEGPSIEKLHRFIKDNGFEFNGKHHEIYLSDPRRCAPEKMKTIIRQPVK